ncbi:transmembrane protein, putative (macronuclear) [Tetrahymena thermophila SB210]|uniref:Transmembrane protein, putative n=1 Tax=Tetrahymena thermophila (strain SB210) TaxID=312017 RepID=Q22BB9_TETTS|nr:transmembrane protein, putative [Tetrahymena thermophila SB210]EAR82589.2 transmembrane protein, putative [Tetrahymena thermophila SB210]|eukprot:XP_001030252.2 transmembrane protein, putative [Tetrahymena thermophila SB210]
MIYDREIDILLAFDIEGNILILKFKSLTLVKKVPSITKTQILNPYLDISKNLIIGFSSDKVISLDYNSLLIDQYNAYVYKQTSISTFYFEEEKNNIYFLRNDGYLYLWDMQQLQFEYLTYLPNIYTVNSKLYYFQNQQLLLIITTIKTLVYNIKLKTLTNTYMQGCQSSSQISQFIICAQGFQIQMISINTENKLDFIDINQGKLFIFSKVFKINFQLVFKAIIKIFNFFEQKIFLLISLNKTFLFNKYIGKTSHNFIAIQGSNQQIVAYYRSKENSLIIYNPNTQKEIQNYQNYHQSNIKALIIKKQYVLTFELAGILKIAFGNSFQYIYQLDQFKNTQIDNLESFSNDIFYIKTNQQIFPYKISFIDDKIKIINASPVNINCKASSIKFSNNGSDLLVVLCSNDLIYTFLVIDQETKFAFKQVQQFRKLMLQDSFIQSLFFIDQHMLALEYQNRQIIIFLNDDYTIKKIGKNEVIEQEDFNIIKIKYKNNNLHSLIYYDVKGIKNIVFPLLAQAKNYSQYSSCQYVNQFRTPTQINNMFKSIQDSYDFFKCYLVILNFNITLNLQEQSYFNSGIEFSYQGITNLTIRGQVDSQGQFQSIASLSKDFIKQGSKYNQLAFYNLKIENIQNNSDEYFTFENFQNLIMQNIYFDNYQAIKLFKISFVQIYRLILKDWKILNQEIDLQNTSYLEFVNNYELQIENMLIQKCTISGQIEESLFEIINSNNIIIQNLTLDSNNILKSKFFKVTYAYNVLMNKVLIQNNVKQQLKKKNQIQIYIQSVFEIQHVRTTRIENGFFISNKDVQFIDYHNTISYTDRNQNEIISKQKDDQIIINKFDFIDNTSQNPIVQIQSQSILFEEVQILQNKMQQCLFLDLRHSIAVFKNITVSENSSKNNLLLIQDSQITIQFSKFLSNKQNHSLLQVISSNITQINSEFIQNVSKEDGGAFNIQNTENETVEFRNNIFKLNKAKGSGGAIYSICYQFVLESNTFQGNQAGIGGAIRYQKYIPTYIQQRDEIKQQNPQKQVDSCGTYSNNICENNKGLVFGMNIGSYPRDALIVYMGKKFKLSQKNIIFEGVRSGQSDESFTIQLLDENEMIIHFPDCFTAFSKNLEDELLFYKAEFFLDNKAERLQDQDIKIEGSTIKEYQKEGFNFNQLFLYGIPNYQSFMFLKTNSIYAVQNNLVNTSELQIFQLQLNFRECLPGEVINQICVDCRIYECKQCLEGTYSLAKPNINDEQMKQCKKCSSQNTENCQLNQIKLKKGFWRESQDSDIIVECSNNPQNCAGKPEKGYCVEGLIGPLCETCDIRGETWGMPYGKSYFNQYKCSPCKNQSYLIFQIAFAILFIIYTTYTIIQVINQSNLRIICYFIRKTGLLKLGRTAIIGQNTLYFKLLIHQLQLLLNLKPFKLNIQPLFSYSETISVPVIANIDSIDCFLYAFNKHIPHYVIKFGWCLIYLILIFIISVAFYRLFVFYQWKKFIPGLTFLVLVWPVTLIWKLHSNKEKLESSYSMIKKLGFLYFGYKQKYYFWEFVKMYQRILIIFVVNYNATSESILGLLILLITFSYSTLFNYIEPYRDNTMNKIEKISSTLISLIFLLANIAKNVNSVNLYITVLVMYSCIILLVLHLLGSILSNLFSSNSNQIIQNGFMKRKHLQNQSIKNNLNVTNTVQSFFKIKQPFKSNDQVDTYKQLQITKKQGDAIKDLTSSIENDFDFNLQVKESNSAEIKNKNNQLCNRVIDSRMGPNSKLNKKPSIPQLFLDSSQIFHLTKEITQFNSHRFTESQNMI